MDRDTPKPKGLQAEYASQFKDLSVAAAYRHRPDYPEALFPMLADLVVGSPRTVLDAGCGTGFVARPLVSLVDRVDGVDFSAPMLEIARSLPNGDHPHIRWIHGPIEEVELDPPYGLITAGASLHWMEWSVVMPRFRHLLVPGGVVALVGATSLGDAPWWQELLPIIQRYSTNRDFQPYDTVAELTGRGLFTVLGRTRTEPVAISQSVADYVESFHARNGLSRDRMQPEMATAFDAAATEILTPHVVRGKLHWQHQGTLVWGVPDPPEVPG
jgi:SAM-dependent methyltransferase